MTDPAGPASRSPRALGVTAFAAALAAIAFASASARAQLAEATDLAFCPAQRDCLAWTPDAAAGAHRLYRGVGADLAGLADAAQDACLRTVHAPPQEAQATLMEAPDPGALFWYLAVAADSEDPASATGPAGEGLDAATGLPFARVLDAAEECPFACNPDYRPQPNVGLVEPPGIGDCPAGMVGVADFCIDRWEASLVRVGEPGSAEDGAPHSPLFHPGADRVRAISAPGALPQGNISGVQAAAACAEAGKRLCTDAEWLRACRGPTGTTWPYGDVRQPGACNDARAQHPAIEYFQTTEPWIWSELDHPCLNQLFDGLARGGAYAACSTFEGAFDMAGNLAEWTAHSAQHFDFTTGFRCCADP